MAAAIPGLCLFNAGVCAGLYTVHVDDGMSSLEATACFAGTTTLSPAPAPVAGSALAVSIDGRRPDTAAMAASFTVRAGECMEYRLAMNDLVGDVHMHRPVHGGAGYRLLNPYTWLWLPETGPGEVQLKFILPPGISVSAPWQETTLKGAGGVFRVPLPAADRAALIGLGRFYRQNVRVAGTDIRLAIADVDDDRVRRRLAQWVTEGADAITRLYGRFPLPAPQVMVIPSGPADEVVPWGQVLRGGGAGVHLFVDQTRSTAALRGDWVLVHELSHLLHPDLGESGRWLAEGLATYYQNVLRARAGMMDADEAWRKLHAGFRRGQAETRPGVSLRQANRRMMEERLFMRVYWSGAAFALQADLALRRRGSSLDAALAQFQACCLPGAEWSPEAFIRKLDEPDGHGDLQALYAAMIDSDRFPDLQPAYQRLGLRAGPGRLSFTDTGAAAELRGEIMQAGGDGRVSVAGGG